jgi:hypothetical protein
VLGDSTTMFPLSCVCFNGVVCCTRGDVFFLGVVKKQKALFSEMLPISIPNNKETKFQAFFRPSIFYPSPSN